MRTVRVSNRERAAVVGDQVRVADRWWARLRGLIGRPPPEEGEGLLIPSSQGVHMWWMRYSLDVALLDAEGQVVALYPRLRPGGRTRLHWKARYALELPIGTLSRTGTEIGDRLEWAASAPEGGRAGAPAR
ncbi:MAG: DUF192 domain-containing protein [Gemmatimonadota bacterium]